MIDVARRGGQTGPPSRHPNPNPGRADGAGVHSFLYYLIGHEACSGQINGAAKKSGAPVRRSIEVSRWSTGCLSEVIGGEEAVGKNLSETER